MPSPEPSEAAAVILLRDSSPFEILMVARNPAGPVMGGVWVFPGGRVAERDGSGEGRLRAAALRELAEETAITGLAAADLVAFSRWIAPVSRASTRCAGGNASDGLPTISRRRE